MRGGGSHVVWLRAAMMGCCNDAVSWCECEGRRLITRPEAEECSSCLLQDGL
jgi:hypothetical protein